MTEEQFNMLLNILAAQTVVLHGIMNLIQAHNVKIGAPAGAIQFHDLQKILDSTKSLKMS